MENNMEVKKSNGLWSKIVAWKKRTGKKIDDWSRKTPKRREIYLNRILYLMMTPYLLLFILFTVLPVIMSFLLSFTDFNMLEFPTWRGWQNYLDLFLEDTIFITAVKNTLIMAVIIGPGGYMLSFVFAWLINELPKKIRWLFTLIFYAPSISGNAYLLWQLLFSSDRHGYINSFLINLGIIDSPILWLKNPDYALPILIIVQLWLSLGISFLSFIGGLQTVDKTLYEAAAIDGIKNRWQELWFVTLPQMKSQLLFGAVMQITTAFGIGSVSISLFGQPSVEYSAHTILTHMLDYGSTNSTRLEMGYASAIATILFVMMMVSNLGIQKIIRRVGS